MIEWLISRKLIPYEHALDVMSERVAEIQDGRAQELVWFLEHPPLYTLGTSAKVGDVLDVNSVPSYKTGRGGQVTYHGPGQRVVYLMFDLKQRVKDAKAYVYTLEECVIRTLNILGVQAHRRSGHIGVWVRKSQTQDDKIAAIGVRIQKWVTSHGISLNVAPDLAYYKGIIPCGIHDQGVTSLAALGINVSMAEVDDLLSQELKALF